MSVASIAGVASPLFFGALYTATAADTAAFYLPGASFLVAAAVLLAAAVLGWIVARQAARAEAPA